MKKLLTATLLVAFVGTAIAQRTPPRPPRPGQLPPHPAHLPPRPGQLPPRPGHVPPRPKAPDEVVRDIDRSLRSKPAPGRNYAKSNNGKHKGQYKTSKTKRHKAVRRHR